MATVPLPLLHVLQEFCHFGMYVLKAIYALLMYVCRKSHLHALSTFLSQKQFMYSAQKVFARDIPPTEKCCVSGELMY